MFRLSFYPIADSYLLVTAVAVALLALLALVPGKGRLSGWRRLSLAALRLGVIVLAIFAMLRPTLIYTEVKKQSATLVILADQSRSMSVPDALAGKTRWEVLCKALADAQASLAKLARDFEVKAYAFDSEAHPLTVEKGEITLPHEPEGPQTAIGSTLDDVLRQEAGKRLLGVILLSDGAQRAYAPRDLPPQTAATRLKHLGYPLFTVPIGQSRGLGQAQDVAVKDLVVNPAVFVKNELAISGQVRIDGYVNRDIPVRVLFETAPGKMELMAEQTVKADADGQLLPVQFTFVPQTPGEFKLTLEVPDQPGELVTTNNQLSTFVNVLKGGLNVLYIEGGFRVEQKFIRRALDASPDINVDFIRIDPRDPANRPVDLAERLKSGKYEVYILGDVDSSVFQGDELKMLAQNVERGAGLIMLGGFHSFGAGGYATTPLNNLLPVTMDRFDRQNPDEPARGDLQLPGPLPMRPTALGLMHFALRLAPDRAKNESLWSQLPALDGAYKFRGLSPGALILADSGANVPLLVAHQYGDGRAMAFAGDSTWHWWMRGFESAHKRFWRQIILWLAKKDQAQEGAVWVKLAERRLAPSQRVEFTVGAQDPTGEPAKDAEFKAEIVLPDGSRRPLTLTHQDSQITGSFRDTQTPGDYAVEVKAAQNGQDLGTARARFLVFQQDLELDNAAADSATMESLSAMTGGQSLAPEQLPELINRLTQQTSTLEIQQETKKTFWDTWPFFLMIVCLLSLDWYLRKSWGLV
ncbi:MAG: hypothetical protein ABSA77_05100 [Thermoguttaceae bacterium]